MKKIILLLLVTIYPSFFCIFSYLVGDWKIFGKIDDRYSLNQTTGILFFIYSMLLQIFIMIQFVILYFVITLFILVFDIIRNVFLSKFLIFSSDGSSMLFFILFTCIEHIFFYIFFKKYLSQKGLASIEIWTSYLVMQMTLLTSILFLLLLIKYICRYIAETGVGESNLRARKKMKKE